MHVGVKPASEMGEHYVKDLTKAQLNRISKIVAETLSQRFDDIDIHTVNVRRDLDRDGDALLRIEVVFVGKLRGADVAGAARYLRPALEEVDADLYPLLSFVSKVDYDRGRSKGEAN
jgi:hypothetical protein